MAILLGLAVALYAAGTLAQVILTGRSRAMPPADVVVVMGAAQYDGRPSAQLASRLDHVVTLWEAGGVDRIVVTGGSQPGDRFSEAEASATEKTRRTPGSFSNSRDSSRMRASWGSRSASGSNANSPVRGMAPHGL